MPIDLCGPEIVSPPTLTTPWCWARSPPITLNSVDLPQPDGPMTERNSPDLTLNDTLSTAVIGPSAVSNCTTTPSATSMASFDANGTGIGRLVARSGHHCGYGRSVTRFDPDIDDGHSAGFDGSDCLFKCWSEFGDSGDRAEALSALRTRHAGEVNIGIRNTLTNPTVLNRPVAHTPIRKSPSPHTATGNRPEPLSANAAPTEIPGPPPTPPPPSPPRKSRGCWNGQAEPF